MTKNISIIIPCYNEAANLPILIGKLDQLATVLEKYELNVVFVNDGSHDNSFEILCKESKGRPWITIVGLTRNFGKEAALTAGLDVADGDALIFMDSDLQHPPEVILKFISRWEAGAKVVLGKRISRDYDSPLYRMLATQFYRLQNIISDISIPINVGDFRLIDKQVADQTRKLRESRRFMKGLFAWVGYEPEIVEYNVEKRFHGHSSFNKWRAWNFALEGITSFSTMPLRLWSYLGLFVFALGIFYAFWILIATVLFGVITPGYVTLMISVVIFGGVQLIGIGVLGEYVGRIYLEVKNRPPYLVDQIVRGSK